MLKHMNMIKGFPSIIILVVILAYGCKSHIAPKEMDEFALFTTTDVFDSITESFKLEPTVKRFVYIPKNQDLEKKVALLLDSVSKVNFHNLKIEALSLEENPEGQKHLKVNLQENPGFIIPDSLGHYRSWYDYFQGTMGGEQTTIILIESILQREYTGDWIDELEFYYQNEKISEWDHAFLSGVIKRK